MTSLRESYPPSSHAHSIPPQLLDQLRSLSRSTPTALAIEAPTLLAEQVALHLAALLVPTASARSVDVRVVAPSSPTWSVSEVDSQILSPTLMVPTLRNVIVVLDADAMSPSASDHILKAIEEPASPTTFCLCVSSLEGLSPTIRGRLTTTIKAALHPSDTAAWLSAAGLPEDLATRASLSLGQEAVLLSSLVGHLDLVNDLLDAATKYPPAHLAATRGAALSSLVVEVVKVSHSGSATPVMLHRLERALAAALISAWRHELTDRVRSKDQGLSEPSRQVSLQRRLTRTDASLEILRRHGSPQLALTLAAS